jgi:hypothetical protein
MYHVPIGAYVIQCSSSVAAEKEVTTKKYAAACDAKRERQRD